MKKVNIILTNGFETIEALTPIDILRRCGLEVTTYSIEGTLEVISSHDITVIADKLFDVKEALGGDMLILPGGPGFKNLVNHSGVMKLTKRYFEEDKYIGAICAAPLALSKWGLVDNRNITCHFSVSNEIKGANLINSPVVIDNKLITASGAGRSLDFALALGEVFTSKKNIENLKKGLTIS